jgi:tetratricopeptide (TPR) repeat protein
MDTGTMDVSKQDFIDRGNAAFDAEQYEAALEAYHSASLIDGQDAAVWSLLGLTYANLEFPREAWRSYLLSLHLSPDDMGTVWYAGEFLYTMGDLPLARVFLRRYLGLETDAEKRAEAEELLAAIEAEIGPEPEDTENVDELVSQLENAEQPPAVGTQVQAIDEGELESLAFTVADEGEPLPFEAVLSLKLTGFDSKCEGCSAAIPYDAPFCYICKLPHFYQD